MRSFCPRGSLGLIAAHFHGMNIRGDGEQ